MQREELNIRELRLDELRRIDLPRTRVNRARLPSLGGLYDAEAVAVGIFQHDKVVIQAIFLRVPGRPDPDQSLHLALLVVRVEVQVHPASLPDVFQGFRKPLQRHLGSSPLGIMKVHPTVLRGLPWCVMERFPPERQLPVELVAPDDDRTDPHLSFLHPAFTEKKNTIDISLPRASTSYGRS